MADTKMHSTTFDYLMPTTAQIGIMANLRTGFRDLLDTLETVVPPGRYRSLAATALEEAAMWANKAVTRDSDGSPRVEPPPDR